MNFRISDWFPFEKRRQITLSHHHKDNNTQTHSHPPKFADWVLNVIYTHITNSFFFSISAFHLLPPSTPNQTRGLIPTNTIKPVTFRSAKTHCDGEAPFCLSAHAPCKKMVQLHPHPPPFSPYMLPDRQTPLALGGGMKNKRERYKKETILCALNGSGWKFSICVCVMLRWCNKLFGKHNLINWSEK